MVTMQKALKISLVTVLSFAAGFGITFGVMNLMTDTFAKHEQEFVDSFAATLEGGTPEQIDVVSKCLAKLVTETLDVTDCEPGENAMKSAQECVASHEEVALTLMIGAQVCLK